MNLTDPKDVLYSLSVTGHVSIRFTDRASLRRWQTSFNSVRDREEGRIMTAWQRDVEKGLNPPPPDLPWGRVRTWTAGEDRLTLKVGVPTPEDLGIITGKEKEHE